MWPEDTFAICDSFCDEDQLKNGERGKHIKRNGYRHSPCVIITVRLVL